jgi:hypothetical protein
MAFFRVRRQLEELEARLTLTDGGGRAGKVEIKRYADDSAKLTIRLRDLDMANGGRVAVLAGEREMASVPIDRGRGEYRLEGRSRDVPQVAVGEAVVVTDGTSVLASGLIVED